MLCGRQPDRDWGRQEPRSDGEMEQAARPSGGLLLRQAGGHWMAEDSDSGPLIIGPQA